MKVSTTPPASKNPSAEKKLRGLAYWSEPRQFSTWQRIQIAVIGNVSALLVRVICCTLRWESRGDEHLETIYEAGKRPIFTFWHGQIFPATWYWRNRGIVVMTSQNFDGEYIARCIQKLGYGAARGSSSRGGMKALAEMARALKQGAEVAFTVDGPKGPRRVAKMGPVLLAKRTGHPVFCFHISLQRKIRFNTWDRSQVPLPFCRALILKAPPIYVTKDANEAEVMNILSQVQQVLDRLEQEGEAYWKE